MIGSLDPLPPIPEFLPRLNDSTSTSFDMACPSRSQGVSLCGRQRLLAIEDVVSRIYNLVLDTFHVVFFDKLIFDIPHLSKIISRPEMLNSYRQASVFFDSHAVFTTQRTVGFESLKL